MPLLSIVALNYGVFRRNDFNSTVHNVMFFDMGAGSTTVSIVGYQIVKTKEKTFVETYPQLVVKGLGVSKSNSWKITSFSKTTSLQREPFLTMFYTINSSPLFITK